MDGCFWHMRWDGICSIEQSLLHILPASYKKTQTKTKGQGSYKQSSVCYKAVISKSLSLSSSQTPLYSHVNLLDHFLSYYDTLDNVATHENLIKLLFLSWCNSLEISFLFLGDLHPYVFTNFVRSFFDEESKEKEEKEDDDDESFDNRPWQVFMA